MDRAVSHTSAHWTREIPRYIAYRMFQITAEAIELPEDQGVAEPERLEAGGEPGGRLSRRLTGLIGHGSGGSASGSRTGLCIVDQCTRKRMFRLSVFCAPP